LQRTSDSGIRGVPGWVREDRVTGLRSRAYFDDILRRDFALAQRESRVLALLVFDVDQMSCYNETFERTGGDACLKRIARALTTAFRRGSDLVARWDGAGFAALLPNVVAAQALEQAQAVAQRIHSQQLHHPHSTHRFVTVSVGVAVRVPAVTDIPEQLVSAAEAALTRAKAQGRNRALLAAQKDFPAQPRAKNAAVAG
jgi:diguanylate cyclase (GGDEF)-like protein